MFFVLIIILAVVIGLGITAFSFQNPSLVTVSLASFRWENVPLFLVVLLSVLVGLLVAWIFGIITSLSTSITLFGKDIKIKNANKEVESLRVRMKELEDENKRLRTEKP